MKTARFAVFLVGAAILAACDDSDGGSTGTDLGGDTGGDAGGDAGADLVADGADGGPDAGGDAEPDADAVEPEPLEPGIGWYEGVRPIDVTPDGRTVLVQDMNSLDGDVHFLDTATGELTYAATVGDVTKCIATGISADLRISALHEIPVQAGVWSEADGWTDLESPFEAGCDQDLGGAFDISDDGSVVVGLMWDGCEPLAFRATAEGVVMLETLGEPLPGGTHPINRATVVSGDGQVIAGFATLGALDRSPARWDADGTGELLDPDNRDTPGEVMAIDGDGSTLAGITGFDGWVWTESGRVDLGRPVEALPADPVFPNAMSADGEAVFGAVGSEFFGLPIAFVWTEADGSRAIRPLVEAAGIEIDETAALMNVLAVSNDGSVLAGNALDAEGMPQTFVLVVDPTTWD